MKARKPSRAERNIRWIESHCPTPDGGRNVVGKPLKLRPWQKKIVRGIYGGKLRRVIISVGRKNGKTALSAALLLLHLVGPESKRNSELYSTGLSREQAAVTFRLAAKMVRLSQQLSEHVTVRDTVKQLYCEGLGTLYTALSADASTAMGLSPVFTIHDELGQVKGPRHPLYEALETATGAQDEPLSVIISTQAPNDADLLSVLIDDAKTGKDSRTKLFLWEAPKDDDPFADATIKKANPAFGDFQNAREIRDMAEAARRMPAREAEYRNLILNQRVEASNPFVTQTIWEQNADEPECQGRFYGGLDLSEVNDLTCLLLASPNRGGLDVKPVFWLPEDGLVERSRLDRVPYDVWHKQGFLNLTPGKSVEYKDIAEYLVREFEQRDIRKIAFDRYNMRHLKPWLLESGMSAAMVEDRFEEFGQGYYSMSPALRVLESLLLNGRIRHGAHPVLTMCATNAVVKRDEAGGRKLDKKRSRGRIDGMVALAMAASIASSELEQSAVFPVELESILE